MLARSAQRTIANFHGSIANPAVFSGGGSVAAIAAAGAASTALLVMRLDLKRRANAAHAETIGASIRRTEEMIEQLHGLADADIATLDALLVAQRELKSNPDDDRFLRHYSEALTAAARSPLTIGDTALELLHLIADETSRASRFTISDLGAAAALLDGACRAACLTAEVNIALLRDARNPGGADADDIDRRRSALLLTVSTLARQIEDTTRSRIHGSSSGTT